MKNRVRLILHFILAATIATTASGQSPRMPDSISTTLSPGLNSVDVTVSFEYVENLTLINLGLGALALNPPDILLLMDRLPASVSIPDEFPAKITISPLSIPLVGLTFEGIASIVLDTDDLDYTPGTRLRLFSAHGSEDFVDITEEVSEGSYRVRGSRGEFSEFLIVRDERDPATVVDAKFSRLSTLMTTHEPDIDSSVFAALTTDLSSAQAHWLANDVDPARSELASFQKVVAAASAAEIPRKWRSTGDLSNVAGLLRAAAGTLYFSLEDARDTDLDGSYDFADNCTLISNASQCDTNGDGYGNHCDADLDNNGTIDSTDLTILRKNLGQTGDNDADLDCNGVVNTFDLTRLLVSFGGVPGPGAN